MYKVDPKAIAVIGVGYWGKNLVRVFYQLKALNTVCDLDKHKLEEVKREYPGVNITESYLEVLKNRQIKAVVISAPAKSHYTLVKDALLAGKDVFVEKPLALTVENGVELVELAQKLNKVLLVGHLLEYHPAIVK